MREGGVADHGDGGIHAGVGGSLGHGDGRAHVHATVDGAERRQRAERVAADVAEDAGVGIFGRHLVQGRVDVAVAAALAELGRARREVAGVRESGTALHAERRGDAVGRQLAHARQFAAQAAGNGIFFAEDAADLLLHEGLAVLDDEDAAALCRELADFLNGQRILRNLHDGDAGRNRLLHIIIGNACGDHAEVGIRMRGDLQPVERGLLRAGGDLRLLRDQRGILPARVAREQHPVGALVVGIQRVLRLGLPRLHRGAGMRQARDEAHQHRQPQLLGEREGVRHHVVGFLLVGGLQDGHHGEFPVETGILLVLRGMHGRIVRSQHHQAAFHARDGGVDEGVGADVHAHVLHAHKRPLAGVRHAQRGFHRRLLVGAPTAVHAAFPRERTLLDVFGNLGRRRAGIGIDTGQAGIQGPEGHGFIAKKQSFLCHFIIRN